LAPGFLLAGDVFTPDVIDTCVDHKRSHEINDKHASASIRVCSLDDV
jgi:hypothetical protein